jgi:hypothetical protein
MAEYIKTGYKRILKICPICKMEKWMVFNQKVCPGECAKEHNRQLQKEWYRAGRRKVKKKAVIIKPAKTEHRELSDLTEGLICIYTHASGERNTVKQIAEDLSRPVKQVKSILSEARKSGRYEKYIEQLEKYHNIYYELQERGAV